MKRLTVTNADWFANIIDAEDRCIRKRARLDPLRIGSAYREPSGHPYVAAHEAAAARYAAQNERDMYGEEA